MKEGYIGTKDHTGEPRTNYISLEWMMKRGTIDLQKSGRKFINFVSKILILIV